MPDNARLPADLFDQFRRLTVLIVGDVMLDAYVWGRAGRLSPEAPVPVVNVTRRESRLGGAANVALNVRALGATPLLCAVIGQDRGGDQLLHLLHETGLSVAGIIPSPDRPTTVKERVLAQGQQLVRLDEEVEAELNDQENGALLRAYEKLLPQADVVVFEDYDKGVLTAGNIRHFIELARRQGTPTVVDPKRRNFLAYSGCTLFKPNLKELREGLQLDFGDTEADRAAFELAVARLRELLRPAVVLVTLSERGVFVSDGPAAPATYLPAHVRTISDVSGAGDTVISIAALCMALGISPVATAALANLGGGLVCEQVGVVPIAAGLLRDEALASGLLQVG